MAKKIDNFAQKSATELKETVKTLRAELMKLRLDHAKRQLKHTSNLTNKRKEIAKALTALQEKSVRHAQDAKEVKNG